MAAAVSSEFEEAPSLGAAGGGEGDTIDPAHLVHPAILAMTALYGEDPTVLVEEVRAVWPELLDREVAPLADWSTVEPILAETILDATLGKDLRVRQSRFEKDVLGVRLEEFLEQRLRGRSPEEVRAMERRCGEVLEGLRPLKDALEAEWTDLVLGKLALGQYDRWPYVTLTKRREHTEQGKGRLFYSYCAAMGDSCWVVGFEVYQGESPSYEAARAAWEAAAAAGRQEIEGLLAP